MASHRQPLLVEERMMVIQLDTAAVLTAAPPYPLPAAHAAAALGVPSWSFDRGGYHHGVAFGSPCDVISVVTAG
jgi:hypothetical protein